MHRTALFRIPRTLGWTYLHSPIRGIRMAHATPNPTAAAVTRRSDPSSVAMVVGASRGIGLAMVQALVSRNWKGKIIAACRDPDSAGALGALWQFMPDRFHILKMDICDEDSVSAAAKEALEFIGEKRLDMLLHTAGVLHENGKMPETSLTRVDVDFFMKNVRTNLIGPVLVGKHFTPMMTTARKEGRVESVYATLSARVGSISDNGLGGWLSYRASKAGQNQAMKTMSIELKRRGVIVAALHPGTVNTQLSEPFQKNVKREKLFAVDDAAGWLLDVVESLGIEDTGGFYAYDRSEIPF